MNKLIEFIQNQQLPIFMLVMGISGSGKTKMIKKINEKFDMDIVSFGEIRCELERNELYNISYNEIIEMANERIKKKLKQGKSVIFESAGLNSYRRAQFLKTLKKISCIKICVVRLTDFETCLNNQENKVFETSEDIVWKQYELFQPPLSIEGWDYISKIVYNNGPTLEEIIEKGKTNFIEISQHLEVISQMAIDRRYPAYLVNAAKYHDIGKFFSKKIEEPELTYPNHENIGAYLYALNSNDTNWNYISNLILWHSVGYEMTPEKRRKIQKRFGQKFTNDLILLTALNKESKNVKKSPKNPIK